MFKDIIHPLAYRLQKNLSIINGEASSFLLKRTHTALNNRTSGNLTAIYLNAHNFEDIPKIINKDASEIKNYLGSSYLYEPVMSFKNFHMYKYLLNYDVHSNILHQASHDS